MGARAIRVLIVGPSLRVVGGQAVQAAQLVEGLRGEASVEVSFAEIDPLLPGPLRALQRIKYLRTALTSALFVARLLARIPRQDVVQIFSASHLSFVLAPTPALVIARCFGTPTILNYHSGEADLHLRRWRRTAPRTMRLADAIVVPSAFLVAEFRRHRLEVRLIRNLVDLDRFPFREPRPREPVFLCNRGLLPVYDVACVLRAFALVQAQLGHARLVVTGDGSQRRELEALARRLRLHNVEFVGWVPPARSPKLYAAAEIFLNGSTAGDNIPLSILEAFAAGVPVISTDPGGISELVRPGATGMLVPAGDHEQMAAQALRLLADPGLASTLVDGARREAARFTWDAQGRHWLALYRELAHFTNR